MSIMSNRIRACRKQMGLTQAELAEKLGIQNSAVAKYENGRVSNIKRSTIQTMAEIFNVSPVWLMGIEEQSESPSINTESLSQEDMQLLETIKKLTPEQKQAFLALFK